MTHFRVHDMVMPGVDPEEETTSTIYSDQHDLPSPEKGGDDYGRVMVCLSMDDAIDGVYVDLGRTDQIAALERAIAALTVVATNLRSVYKLMDADRGQCLGMGYDDRCELDASHDGEHGPLRVTGGDA